jgi:superfamily II DNA or RNA helicase
LAPTTPDTHAIFEASQWSINDTCLTPEGKARWKRAIPHAETLDSSTRAQVKDSWAHGINFSHSSEPGGQGLRPPQSGALHAIAAHWSVKTTPGLVVMPTGTGKTDTMIAAMVMRAPRRTLVLVPSDVLRTQLSEKFQGLGVLRSAGVLHANTLNPVIGIPVSSEAFSDGIDDLKLCNVVISTVAMIDQVVEEKLSKLSQLFDVTFVDEVHHAPARSWRRILDSMIDSALVGFSATPFREDALRIPGSIIYNFPLRIAQKQGYFRPLTLKLIDQPDPKLAHEAIARAAVEQLRSDDKLGFRHIILARTSIKKHAEWLLAHVYELFFPDLYPVVVHSSSPGRNEILERIRRGHHRIVICVDMFGEGFDMPSLKIAALHVIHKSLAITLQFTGRFTRSSSTVGDATIVANVASESLSPALVELYAESADWQELLPRLSESAIGNELQAAEFESTAKAQNLSEASLFDLVSISPSLRSSFFRAKYFSVEAVARSLPKSATLHAQWISDDSDLVICITKAHRPISWASARGVSDEIWELWLVAYNRDKQLLYVNVSSRSSLQADFAKRITSQTATLISGEKMFRALADMKRLKLYNVGLYGKGRLRFRMFTGRDVAEQITLANQANNSKSNLFGSGYEDGAHRTLGVSHKGRVWSMEATTIPGWKKWCDAVAKKLTDGNIKTDEFLKHTLNPKAVSSLPDLDILAVIEPDAWLLDEGIVSRIAISETQAVSCRDIYISSFAKRGESLRIVLAHDETEVAELQLNWGPGEEEQRVSVVHGPAALAVDEETTSWLDYLLDHPFTILFADGSELQGGVHLQRADGQAILFDKTHGEPFVWKNTPIKVESKWKGGVQRTSSVQGFWIEHLMTGESQVIMDDDDANESADVVEFFFNDLEITCRLYHCKYAGGEDPGLRVSDVQVVCAQAVRSAKWADAPVALINHLQLREDAARRGGRPTRFEKGGLQQLSTIKRLLPHRRFNLQIYVVQPGLALNVIDRNISLVLGASDNFIHELTGYPLTVVGS